MTSRTLGIGVIGILIALLLLSVLGCAHVAPTVSPATTAIYRVTCIDTWWEELGEPTIEQFALLACIQAAIHGQTVAELRALLRARPDYHDRSRSKAYGKPPTLGLHAT